MINLFTIATKDIYIFALIFFRMSGLLIIMPFFGGEQISVKIRMAFVIGFTLVMFNHIPVTLDVVPGSIYELVLFALREMGIAVILGFIASIAFFAIQVGGQIIGIQIGLARSRAIDPLAQGNIPIIGQFLTMFVLVIFLLFDGHHMILKIFVESFERVPIGQVHFSQELFGFVIQAFNDVFIIGMRIAMPAMVMMFTVMTALGLVARLVPQMNVFMLSLPFKVGGGIMITAICLPLVVILFKDTFLHTIEVMYKTIYLFAQNNVAT